MADDSKHEARKHKKKHRKKSKEAEESTEEDTKSPFNNNMEEPQSANKEPIAVVNTKDQDNSRAKMAPKAKIPVTLKHTWTKEEREKLVKALQVYGSQEEQKNTSYSRVDWKAIDVDGIDPNDLNEEYKRLTKKVRKLRTVKEVVGDMVQQRNSAPGVDKDMGEKPPKKPTNGFMLFCKAKRPSLLAKHPELTFAEVHKKLCMKWKETPEKKKRKYMKKYEKEKKVYTQELKEYKERQRLLVKKPMTAFEMWKEERIKEGLHEDESERGLKEEWEALPMSIKKGWMHAASSDEDRYKTEIKPFGTPKGALKKATSDIIIDHEDKRKTANEDDNESDSSDSDDDKTDLKRKLNTEQIYQTQTKKAKQDSSSDESSSSED